MATLPALFAICASLGIAHSQCSPMFISGRDQTDQSKWYTGVASWPNKNGKPPESQCRHPVPVETYKIYDGSRGTTYACLAPIEDDHLTSDDIAALTDKVKRINSIEPKTLEDHEMSLMFKRLATAP